VSNAADALLDLQKSKLRLGFRFNFEADALK
jgi:hypothetical protein